MNNPPLRLLVKRIADNKTLSTQQGQDTVHMFKLAIHTLNDIEEDQGIELYNGDQLLAMWDRETLPEFFVPSTNRWFLNLMNVKSRKT